ncbi:hypothetical protein JCM11641_006004 [Rhodosporidiobolus odoratus]
MPDLKQESVARLLRRTTLSDEVEEILGAYLLSKQLKGRNATQVHRSLYLLSHYLNAVGLGHLYKQHTVAFSTVAALALSSTPISHVVTPTTPLGLEAWNEVRRRPSGWLRWGNSSESIASAASSISEAATSTSSHPTFWRAFLSLKPPTYSADTTGYVDRDGEEGRQRVEQDDERTALPTYA